MTDVDETNCRLTYVMEALDLLRRGVPAFGFLHSSDLRRGRCSPEEAERQIKKLYDDYASGSEDKRVFETLEVLGLRFEDLIEEKVAVARTLTAILVAALVGCGARSVAPTAPLPPTPS